MLDHMSRQFSYLPLPAAVLRMNMEGFIGRHLELCHDVAFSACFPFRETGLPQDFFLQKIIHVGGETYLTGPRYIGGDISRPFVDVIAQSAEITLDVFKAIISYWKPMNPLSIRLLRQPGTMFCGTIDQYVYIGLIEQLRVTNAAAKTQVTLNIARSSDLVWCRHALKVTYGNLHRAFPALKENVLPTDSDDLADAIAENTVFLVLKNSVKTGFLICEHDETAFLKGFRISEEVILPAYRGQHLAARAQQVLCQQILLDDVPHSLLIGTIIPGNIPSIKTAEHAGRLPLLEYVFLNLSDFDE